jgi:hypothetical protein
MNDYHQKILIEVDTISNNQRGFFQIPGIGKTTHAIQVFADATSAV